METETKKPKFRVRIKGAKKPACASLQEKKTIHQLAIEQGVKPIKDPDKLAGYFPEDADPDSYIEAVRKSRNGR